TRYTPTGYESMDPRRGGCAFALIVGRASAATPTIVGMRVARLFRFPVKGFPAEELTEARGVKDRGIRGDRGAAFTNGSRDVPDDACQALPLPCGGLPRRGAHRSEGGRGPRDPR